MALGAPIYGRRLRLFVRLEDRDDAVGDQLGEAPTISYSTVRTN